MRQVLAGCVRAEMHWCASLSAVAVLGPFGLFLRDMGENGSFPSSNKQQKAVIAERGLILRKRGKRKGV